jgi:hypothetical protein
MKMKQMPTHVSAWLEVTPDEFQELEHMEGLMLRVETGNSVPAYYWRVQGTWILLTVKEHQRGQQPHAPVLRPDNELR